MTTLVTADDKGRICIRGTKRGRKYRVTEAEGGWWVMPDQQDPPPRNQKEWPGGAGDLWDRLQELGDGLHIEEADSGKGPVPPCQF